MQLKFSVRTPASVGWSNICIVQAFYIVAKNNLQKYKKIRNHNKKSLVTIII